jgi:F-type H+-transporting ATPase subunit delta
VRTAVELDSGLGDVIKQAFETKLNKTISVKRQIDPSLIGGIQIRIGNTIYDASVKKHLSMMKQLLLQQG